MIKLNNKNIDNNLIKNESLEFSKLSKSLIRTNPSLTGNVKIVIDSNYQIYLNSINANAELENSKYQKYKVSSNSFYPVDLKRFLNDGKIDTQIFNEIPKKYEISSTKSSFNDEYDDLYLAGASYLKSKLWNEKYSYFAPIWMDEIIPDYFVIFSTESNIALDDSNENWKELIKESRIVKSYSLKDNSEIGKYIRKIQNSKEYIKYPLNVQYDKEKYTTYNGILWDEGIIGNRLENMYEFWQNSNTLLNTEEYIIDGFKRNKIVSSNLLNLEFLFDDSENLFQKQRYWGMYVSENEIDYLDANLDAFFLMNSSNSKLPNHKERIIWDNPHIISNESGIDLWLNKKSNKSDSFEFNYNLLNNSDTINYIKYNDSINLINTISEKFQPHISEDLVEIKIKNKSLNVSELFSRNKLSLQRKCEYANEEKANVSIKFTSIPNVSDVIELSNNTIRLRLIANNIYFATSTVSTFSNTTGNKFIEITGNWLEANWNTDFIRYYNGTTYSSFIEVDNITYNSTTNKTKFFFADTNTITTPTNIYLYSKKYYNNTIGYNNTKDFYYLYYTNLGSLDDALYNICGLINNSTYNISAYHKDNVLTIFSNNGGIVGNVWSLNIDASIGVDDGLDSELEVLDDLNTLWILTPSKKFFLSGGVVDNGIVVSEDVKNEITSLKKDYFSCINGWSKYLTITKKIGNIHWNDDHIIKIDEFDKYVITLEQKPYLNSYNEFNMFTRTKVSVGSFTLFPVEDLNWHSLDESYNINPELHHLFYNTPKNEILIPNYQYYSSINFDVYKLTANGVTYTLIHKENNFIKVTANSVPAPDLSINNSCRLCYALTDEIIPGKIISFSVTGTITTFNIEVDNALDINIPISNDLVYYTPTVFSTNCNYFIVPETDLYVANQELIIDWTNDKDLLKWHGFEGCHDFLLPSDEDVINNLLITTGKSNVEIINDRKKVFTYKLLNNPYARTRELWTKENSLKNYIHPNIISWCKSNLNGIGKDYILNNNLAFGTSNFSANSENKNMEFNWMLLELPKYCDENNVSNFWISSNFNQLHSAFLDGNAKKILSEGYNNNFYNLDLLKSNTLNLYGEKYSLFETDESGKLYTFFLGNKIQIQNESLKWNGWSFAISIHQSDVKTNTAKDNKPPIEWKLNEYEKSKHVHLFIQTQLTDYRNILDHIFLYSNSSRKEWITPLSTSVANELHSPYHKLSSTLSMAGNSYINGIENWIKLQNFEITYPNGEKIKAFKTNLFEEIIQNENGIYTTFRNSNIPNDDGLNGGLKISWDNIPNLFDFELTRMKSIKDFETVSFDIGTIWKTNIGNTTGWTQKNPVFENTQLFSNAYTHYYGECSGINRNLINKMSYSFVKNLLDTNDEQIQRWNYDNDGIASKSELLIKFILPEQIKITSEYVPIIDNNKPEVYKERDIIGYNLIKQNCDYNVWRHSGYYLPSFKSIIDFKLEDNKNIFYKRNTSVRNINLANMNINKIAVNEILRTSEQNKYPSLYPYIDDFAFANKKVDVFKTLWNPNEERNYISISEYVNNDKINVFNEKKRILGSTLINLPNQIIFYGGTWNGNTVDILSDIKNWFHENTIDIWTDLLNRNLITDTKVASDKYWNENIDNFYEISKMVIYENSKPNMYGNTSGLLEWKINNWTIANYKIDELSKWSRKINYNLNGSLTAYIIVSVI